MLKSVADALAQFYEAAINGPEAADHAKSPYVRGMVDVLRMHTLDLVEVTVPISTRYRALVDAARWYSDSNLGDRNEMIARRHMLKVELHAFARALDNAKPDDGAAFLGGLNTTQVRNPLADVL